MYELSVAFKYLIPRWRQLSVSIISLISIIVIALVVWLIVVFFSVTSGLEKGWVQKLIALTAPVRISPTEQYYDSYYYLADTISMSSDYAEKTIGEKLAATLTDPYNPDFDQEIPVHWPEPDFDSNGVIKDPVKQAFSSLEKIPGITATEYEMTVSTLKLKLIRGKEPALSLTDDPANQSTISQATYLSSYDPENPNLSKAMLPVTKEDIQNLLDMAWTEDSDHLKDILHTVSIDSLKTTAHGLQIPHSFLNEDCVLDVCTLWVGKQIKSVWIPNNQDSFINRPFNERVKVVPAQLKVTNGSPALHFEDDYTLAMNNDIPLFLDEEMTLTGSFNHESLDHPEKLSDLEFDASLNVQETNLSGKVNWNQLEIDSFQIHTNEDDPFWLFDGTIPYSLPSDPHIGDAILLPKGYRANGVLIGDRGHLSYQTPTASSIQEQRVPIYVAGFYDPGILPFGGKVVLANPYITTMIRSSYPTDHSPLSNGINIRFESLDDAEQIKNQIEDSFQKAGIDKYWKVETYREFDFTKDFLQQLRSERNLFSLISAIVIIVACANIVSMLIILVTNKKMEIGVLRAMGASSTSIALIFGTCGIVMGLMGSAIGLIAALITLQNLQHLIDFISRLQGFELFNPVFYGDTLPNELSFEVLVLVMGATALTSLIAGVVPAVKASLMRPAAILRSE